MNIRTILFLACTMATPLFAQKKPELFVLSIGIERYQDASLNLNYAADDAKDIAAMFKKQQKLWNVREVKVLTNADAKGNQIITAIAAIKKKVTSDDFVVFFFSGHGTDGRLVPYDYDHNPYRTALSREEIFEQLDQLGCGYMVFLDACHSGSFAKSGGKNIDIGPFQDKTEQATRELVDALAGSDKPFLIFGSSGTHQKSWECKACGHGYFAQAILDAFANKPVKEGNMLYQPDSDQNGLLTVSELDDYLKEAVRVATSHENAPQKVYSRRTLGKDIALAAWTEPKGPAKDRDNDGIPDQQDQCPDIAGLRVANGCPARTAEQFAHQITLLCVKTNKKYKLGCVDELRYIDCNGGFLGRTDFKSFRLKPDARPDDALDLYRNILKEYNVAQEEDVLALLRLNKNAWLVLAQTGVYWEAAVPRKLSGESIREFVPYSELITYQFDNDNSYVNIRVGNKKISRQILVRPETGSRGLQARELRELLETLQQIAAESGK